MVEDDDGGPVNCSGMCKKKVEDDDEAGVAESSGAGSCFKGVIIAGCGCRRGISILVLLPSSTVSVAAGGTVVVMEEEKSG